MLAVLGWPKRKSWLKGLGTKGGKYHSYPVRDEDYASIIGNARFAMAMMAWYGWDDNPIWNDAAEALIKGLSNIAVGKQGYAYYPDGGLGVAFCYPRSGWSDTTEPTSDQCGGEGPVLVYYKWDNRPPG